MPRELHDRLARQASEPTKKRRKRGLGKIRDRDAYVYGTMARIMKAERARRGGS